MALLGFRRAWNRQFVWICACRFCRTGGTTAVDGERYYNWNLAPWLTQWSLFHGLSCRKLLQLFFRLTKFVDFRVYWTYSLGCHGYISSPYLCFELSWVSLEWPQSESPNSLLIKLGCRSQFCYHMSPQQFFYLQSIRQISFNFLIIIRTFKLSWIDKINSKIKR